MPQGVEETITLSPDFPIVFSLVTPLTVPFLIEWQYHNVILSLNPI